MSEIGRSGRQSPMPQSGRKDDASMEGAFHKGAAFGLP